MTLDSFVIRIYRRPGRTGRGMVGVVEGDRTGGKQAFTTPEELWELLVRSSRRAARPAPRPGSDDSSGTTATRGSAGASPADS